MKFKPRLCIIFLIIVIISSCKTSPPEIKCTFDEEIFKNYIKQELTADTVLLYSKRLREEAYFPELIALTIVVENPTTSIVDFKTLSLEEPFRFENWDEIESTLKSIGMKYALELKEKCNIKEFNDIIIEFGKRDVNGQFVYRFICHYEEVLRK